MATNNNDKQDALNKALATLKAGGSVYLSKTSLARQIDGKIVVFNPQVVNVSQLQAGNASLTKKKLAAAIAAGKASVITSAQLAAGLNPKPSVPKPVGSAKPKRTIKGKADDDQKQKKPKVKVRKEADPELATGKRLKNPLGALSSYNYQLSLYMITPDAMEIFKSEGYRNINKIGVLPVSALGPDVANDSVTAGAYLVAQSGGINKEFELRAPSFGLDYYMDNLTFEVAGPADTGTAVASYNFNFQITEPYGFSFISNLKRAGDAIRDYIAKINKKRAAVAKKKAAAQQQRTRRRNTAAKATPSRRLTKGGVGGSGVTSVDSQAAKRGNYYNTRFQSNNDILAGVRGTKPGSRPLPKGGKGGGRAAKDSGYRLLTDEFDRQQAAAKQGAGKPKGKDKGPSDESAPYNATKQLFVLGIRFLGYNASGKPVRGTDTTAATNSYSSVIEGAQQEIDPGNGSHNLFERYYPILITGVSTVIDGRTVRYDVTAQGQQEEAMGTKRGVSMNPVEFTAETVGDALDSLMSRLNKEQQKLNKDTKAGYSYDIKYASSYDADRIRTCKIVSKADLDKYKWPGSGAKNTKESNAATENRQGGKPKNNERKFTFAKGTPIIQMINQIVAQSSFLEDALRSVYTTALEPDQEKEGLPALDLSGKKTIEWVMITPDIENLSWNESKGDWVYSINYVLNVYDTPILDSAYTNPGKEYYGPVKRYDYWYSGTNTEILSYKQKVDNTFYTTFLDENFGKEKDDKNADKKGGTNTKEAGGGNSAGSTTPVVQNQRTGQPTQGKTGVGMEAQNSYLTSLFDPTATATATVEIFGDPDWLMAVNNTQYGQNESIVYNKFYGRDGYSISPAGGQVFFEIDFKEAIDYKSEGGNFAINDGAGGMVTGAPGTLSINSSILFWKDPKSISKAVKGLSYRCNTVRSDFRQGVFRQTLSAVLNSFGDSGSNDTGAARENKGKSSNSGPNKGNGNATTSAKGWKNADYEAAKRYSNDPKVRNAAWNKELARRNGVTDKTWQKALQKNPTATTPPKIARNNPET